MYRGSSIFATTAFIFFALFYGEVIGGQPSIKISSYQINGKKPIHAVSDKFLSVTIDPGVLLHVPECRTTNNTLNLVRGILPAYLRVAGPESNKLVFKSSQNGKSTSDMASNPGPNSKSEILQLTGSQWIKFNDFVNKSGLNAIISLNGNIFNKNNDRDLSNALEFISFSNQNNLNLDWQLGYELQKISKDDGKETGRDLTKLKNILELFPRYHKSLILGPDMTSFENRDEAMFLRNYLVNAQTSLNAFTIHPDFSNMKENDDVQEMLTNILSKLDSVIWAKDGALKSVSKGAVPRKPIWIAESEKKDHTCKFSDALSMVKRMGSAAKLGASVYLRKPHLLSLYEPTPEYWVSTLYKALVGRSVLEAKPVNSNNTKVQLFSHCTQILEKPEESILNPTTAYERGSITVYGVNTGLEPARLSLKIGFKFEDVVHLYILTEEMKDAFSQTLLNKQPIGLSSDGELPMISPKVRESARYVTVPPKSIFFVVFPNAKARACVSPILDELQDSKIKIKQPGATEEDEDTDYASFASNLPDTIEDDAEDKTVYVSYPKREERRNMAHSKPSAHLDDFKFMQPKSETNFGIKYVTFPDGSWFPSYPEKFREILDRGQYDEFMKTPPTRKEVRHLKMEKYGVAGKAVLNRRNHTNPVIQSQNMESDLAPSYAEERSGRFLRSIDSHPTMTFKSVTMTDKTPAIFAMPISWSLDQPKSHFDNLRETVFVEEGREKGETTEKVLLKQQISDNNEMNNEVVRTTVRVAEYPVSTSTVSFEEDFEAEEDKSVENVRENRQINNGHSAEELSTVHRKLPKSLGPVSPFPRKTKMKRNKIEMEKNAGHRTLGSPQAPVIPGIVSSQKTSSTATAAEKMETNNIVTNSESTTEALEKSTTVVTVATETVAESSSKSTTSQSMTTEMLAKSSPVNISQITELSSTETTTISTASSTNTSEELLSSTHSSARNMNNDEDLEDLTAASKIVSPIIHSHDTTNVGNPIGGSGAENKEENNVVSLPLTTRMPSKDSKKDIKTKPKHTPASKSDTKPTLEIKAVKVEPAEIIDAYNTKLKELLEQHLAKLEELKKKMYEKSAAARKPRARHVPQQRNKREISSNATNEFVSIGNQQNEDDQQTNDVVGIRRPKPTHPAHSASQTTSAPMSVTSTSKSAPRRPKNSRSQPTNPKARVHTIPTPKSRSHENKAKPIIPQHSTPDPVLRNVRECPEWFDDVFSTAGSIFETISKEVKEDVKPVTNWMKDRAEDVKTSPAGDIFNSASKEVQKNLHTATKWVEDRVEDVKEEFNEKRDKRDLEAVRAKLRQLKQRIQERRAKQHPIFKRHISIRLPLLLEKKIERKAEENLKSELKWVEDRLENSEKNTEGKREKRNLDTGRERQKQLRQKIVGKSKEHRIFKRDVTAHHPKMAEKKKEKEEKRKSFAFRFNLLKNRTARGHSREERNKMAEKLRSRGIFKRHATPNRLRRSISDNEIFDEDEDLQFKGKIHDDDRAGLLWSKLETDSNHSQKPSIKELSLESEEHKLGLQRSDDRNEAKTETKNTNSLWEREYKTDTSRKTIAESQNLESISRISNTDTTTGAAPQEDDDQCKDTNFFRYCWCRAKNLLKYFYKLLHLQQR